MAIVSNKFVLKRDKNVDCRINCLVSALDLEGINYKPFEVLITSTALTFKFLDINPGGRAINTVLGVNPDLMKQFSQNTGIEIVHYAEKEDDVDFEIICNAIASNHCVMVNADRYELIRILHPRLKNRIPINKHMTQHMFVIYGVDTIKKNFLICEPNSSIKKHHSFWVSSKALSKARHCKWLGYDIDNDIYVINSISNYKVKNNEEYFMEQILSLKDSVSKSLPQIRNFISEFECVTHNSVLGKYFVLQTKVLQMSLTGFDLSGCFYRELLRETISSFGDSMKVFENEIIDITKDWLALSSEIKNANDFYYAINVWKELIRIAEIEQRFCDKIINQFR